MVEGAGRRRHVYISLLAVAVMFVTTTPSEVTVDAANTSKDTARGGRGSSGAGGASTAAAAAAAAKASASSSSSSSDGGANRGNTVFFLQDPVDGQCLGPRGFTVCDTTTLWVLASRKEGTSLVSLMEPKQSAMCLDRTRCHSAESPLVAGPCRHCGAKHWALTQVAKSSAAANMWKVTEDRGRNCVVRAAGNQGGRRRDKKELRNRISMQHCKTGFTPLQVAETVIHDSGFYLQTADGMCFDGEKFRECQVMDDELLWGIGVRFSSKGDALRYFFKFYKPHQCLVRRSPHSSNSALAVGGCGEAGALRWGLRDGRLAQDEAKNCVVRHVDNTASMRHCTEGFEFIDAVIPEQAFVDGLGPWLSELEAMGGGGEGEGGLASEVQANGEVRQQYEDLLAQRW